MTIQNEINAKRDPNHSFNVIMKQQVVFQEMMLKQQRDFQDKMLLLQQKAIKE